MNMIFENSLYSFQLLEEEKPTLLFSWTDKTIEMTFETFQTACHNFAGFAWQYQAKHLLVDTQNFNFQLPEEFSTWRETELNPRYYQLGVKKFAHLTKPAFLAFMKDIPAEKGRFETRNFDDFTKAITWISS